MARDFDPRKALEYAFEAGNLAYQYGRFLIGEDIENADMLGMEAKYRLLKEKTEAYFAKNDPSTPLAESIYNNTIKWNWNENGPSSVYEIAHNLAPTESDEAKAEMAAIASLYIHTPVWSSIEQIQLVVW